MVLKNPRAPNGARSKPYILRRPEDLYLFYPSENAVCDSQLLCPDAKTMPSEGAEARLKNYEYYKRLPDTFNQIKKG